MLLLPPLCDVGGHVHSECHKVFCNSFPCSLLTTSWIPRKLAMDDKNHTNSCIPLKISYQLSAARVTGLDSVDTVSVWEGDVFFIKMTSSIIAIHTFLTVNSLNPWELFVIEYNSTCSQYLYTEGKTGALFQQDYIICRNPGSLVSIFPGVMNFITFLCWFANNLNLRSGQKIHDLYIVPFGDYWLWKFDFWCGVCLPFQPAWNIKLSRIALWNSRKKWIWKLIQLNEDIHNVENTWDG